MSNIIKSTRISILSTDKYNIEIPVIHDGKLVKDDEPFQDNQDEDLNNLTPEYILQKAEEKAEHILSQAEEKANTLIAESISDAEFKAEKIVEDAQRDGYTFGYNEAIEEVNQMKVQVQRQLEETILEKEETLEAIEPQMLEMVLQISKSILGTALDINPQIIIMLIKKGLSEANGTGKIFIHISKYDYDVAYQNISQLQEFVSGNADIEILKDSTLNKGDCIIETPFGNIDSGFEQQFESIKNELIYILEDR